MGKEQNRPQPSMDDILALGRQRVQEQAKSRVAKLNELEDYRGILTDEEIQAAERVFEREVEGMSPILRDAVRGLLAAPVAVRPVQAEASKPSAQAKESKKSLAENKGRKEKTRGLNDSRPVEYILPDGRKLRGKEGKVMKILMSELGHEFPADGLIREVFLGINKRKGLGHLKRAVADLKGKLKDTEFHLDTRVSRVGHDLKTFYSANRKESGAGAGAESVRIFDTRISRLVAAIENSDSLTRGELAKIAYPRQPYDKIKKNLSGLLRHVRSLLRSEGKDLFISGPKKGNKTRFSTHPIEERGTVVAKSAAKKAEPAKRDLPTQEEVKTLEISDLLDSHIAVIAHTLFKYRERLEPPLKKRNVKYIDDNILSSLMALADNPQYAYIRKLGEKAKTIMLRSLRMDGFETAKFLIEDDDFEKKLKQIESENPNLYFLLFNLFEIFGAIKADYQVEPMTFIEQLFNFAGIEYVIEDNLLVSKAKIETLRVLPGESDVIPQTTQAVWSEPGHEEAKASEPSPEPEPKPEAEGPSEPMVIQVVREVGERIFVPKLETRDRKVRVRLREFFRRAWGKPVLRKPASIEEINREFQELKWRLFVEPSIHNKLIHVNGSGRGGLPRLDIAQIATLLYIKHYGNKLSSQLKKQVEGIAMDEFKKFEEEKKLEELRRKHRLSPQA